MYYILSVHVIFAIWIGIDGYNRKLSILPWVIGAVIVGPVIYAQYMDKRPPKADKPHEGIRAQTFFRSLALLWTLILVVIAIWGGKSFTNTIYQKRDPLEYRLAVMNTRGCIAENDVNVARFSVVLDNLSQSCIEDRQQIANISVIVHDKVRASGINEPLLNIMEGLSQLLWPDSLKKGRYSEYAFAYVGLRNIGLSHKDAIEQLKAAVSGY